MTPIANEPTVPSGAAVRKRRQDPAEHVDFLLLGGGLASATAAETLRTEQAAGSILIVSDETVAPYHRPPLSKEVLRDADVESRIAINPPTFYRDNAIRLRLSSRVVAVDPAEHSITIATGERIGYGRLLIATGATPKRPVAPGAELAGIHTLHYLADAQAIRQSAAGARRAVVLGGSFLGMEVAMALVDLGITVTLVENGPVLLPRLKAPLVSAYFERHAANRGVRVLLDDTVVAFHGRERVQEVQTASGRRLPCDLVVAGIGVEPASAFLNGSGVAMEDGRIVVDALLATNAPDVFAAGDVTTFDDPVFARRRHIEHWDNAVKQGRLAARNMLGRRLPYDEVSYFFGDIGEIGFNVVGAPDEGQEWIERGDLDAGSFALFYLRDDVPRALFSIDRPADETRLVEGWIRHRMNVATIKDRLHDPSFALDRIPPQTALILQGGGALGAFECGVVKALEEERIFPDIVAGVSIGALNGAIIASNPQHATEALEAFWADLSVAVVPLPFGCGERAAAATQILTFGVPGFFTPRWIPALGTLPSLPSNWTSYYDTAPMRDLLAKYVDFPSLGTSPVRLLISAVNVETAAFEVFDSYVDEITADHVIASGSLPPGFPWTLVDGKAYWDGGIVSNSPLDLVNERCGPDGKRVFIVDLFSGSSPLPTNMTEVLLRRDEIVYSERVRSDLRHREKVGAYRKLIGRILERMEPAEAARIRHRPEYIQLMGDGAATRITRFARNAGSRRSASLHYDFSAATIRMHLAEGYAVAREILNASSRFPLPVSGHLDGRQ
ncbi:MAG: FAD-dependent oxidoreductase [Burkholderiaceae bacterium]|nr:FAD-dependent oxidoreductase [Burkholderiaceae bacterium]